MHAHQNFMANGEEIKTPLFFSVLFFPDILRPHNEFLCCIHFTYIMVRQGYTRVCDASGLRVREGNGFIFQIGVLQTNPNTPDIQR